MRTTVRIDDDLLRTLKERANREQASLTAVVNRVIRQGLASGSSKPARKRFRQRTYDMGVPLVDLTKALSLAAAMEDEERIAKMLRGE
jgi:predicted transcriptional regulator